MTNTTRILVLVTGLAFCSTAEARAQLSQGFVNLNVGAQPQSRDLHATSSFPLYDETATVDATQEVGGGAFFDMSGGYRVWHNVAIAIGFSTFGDKGDAAVAASIPHPAFLNQPATVNTTAPGLKHSELGVHLQAVWMIPVTDKIDVAFSLGPSFFRVKQDLVTTVTVQPGTQTVTGVVVDSQKKTGTGANIGIDANYLLTRRFFFIKRLGAGLFMRYAGASVDLPAAENVKAGGFQIGIGLRARF